MSHAHESLQENSCVEFKDSFDPKHGWCELIKDIVAMANSGGGQIFIGLFDNGAPSNADVTNLLEVDMADVVNKIRGFTDINFSSLSIGPGLVGESRIAAITVRPASSPLVFNKSGNYVDHAGKQKCAFNPGTIYVRHGPKSEPATTDDLRTIIETRISQDRQSLLGNLRQVVEAPADSVVNIVAAGSITSGGSDQQTEVRIVDSAEAKPAIILDPNETNPFRQKEVVEAINQHFAGELRFTSNDNVALRRLYDVESQKKFYYKPKTGSAQYSKGYIDWIIGQIESDKDFLPNLRQNYHKMLVAHNVARRSKQ